MIHLEVMTPAGSDTQPSQTNVASVEFDEPEECSSATEERVETTQR